ncbi:MAG: hypothetical protein CO113_13175 [Elusimicrobia bacterium CG_4_9_14_3_um_filter_62_55]|nr:MAG: hypothetical protein CO113_13175 [Elusimicrobia bacterium CG_4_9_14_3_um_filter_62_55]
MTRHGPYLSLKTPGFGIRHLGDGRFCLVPSGGDADGGHFAISTTPFLIGRAFDNHLVLPDSEELRKSTSRWHCRILNQNQSLLIADGAPSSGTAVDSKASITGTILNGVKLTQPMKLRNGDRVIFGAWEVEFFSYPEAPGLDSVLENASPLGAASGGDRSASPSLSELVNSLRDCRGPGAYLERYLKWTCEVLEPAGAAVLFEHNGEKWVLRKAWTRSDGISRRIRFSASLLERFKPGEAYAFLPANGKVSGSQLAEGIRSGVVLPLSFEGIRPWALYLDDRDARRPFCEADLLLSTEVARVGTVLLGVEQAGDGRRLEDECARVVGAEKARDAAKQFPLGIRGMGTAVWEVVILSCDVSSFYQAAMGSEGLRLETPFDAFIRVFDQAVRLYGGIPQGYAGDCFNAVFRTESKGPATGFPVSDAGQALRAAQQVIAEWVHGQTSKDTRGIAVRFGLHVDSVLFAPVTVNSRSEFGFFGRGVKIAEGLAERARPNGMALSEPAKELLKSSLSMSRGEGFIGQDGKPIALWHVGADSNAVAWEIGQVVDGTYEVLDILGKGGMGVVYKVRHRDWSADLAVKRATPELLASQGGLERFVREAETWVNLPRHPNIATAHYIRVFAGQPAIFMEFFEGRDLREWCREHGTPGLAEAISLAIQISWGMSVAHDQGLVHRDLKPSNILVNAAGEAKITDFGLVKPLKDLSTLSTTSAQPRQRSPELTAIGGWVGTPSYMSPEQWADEGVGPSADIYSFGIMLYELVCRMNPFKELLDGLDLQAGKMLEELRRMHVESAPRTPESVGVKLPTALSAMLMRCMEKTPERRPKNFREISDVLLAAYAEVSGKSYPLQDLGEIVERASDVNNRALSMLDLGRVKPAVRLLQRALEIDPSHPEAVYNLASLRWVRGEIDDVQAVRAVEAAVQRATRADNRHLLGFLHLARADSDAAERELRTAVENRGDDSQILSALDAARARSSDIRHLGYLEGHKGYVISLSTSPDGSKVVSGSFDRTLRRWDVRRREQTDRYGGLESVEFVAVSPDGRYALCGGVGAVLAFWNLETGVCERRWEGHSDSLHAVAFGPDGSFCVTAASDESLRVWDLNLGECVRIMRAPSGVIYSVALSADGRRAFSGSGDGCIRVWDIASGSLLKEINGHEQAVVGLAVTPYQDGLLSCSRDGTIRVWDMETFTSRFVLRGHSGVSSVAVSPDGRFLVSGGMEGEVRLWDLKAGRCMRTFGGGEGSVYTVAFALSGRTILAGGIGKRIRCWSFTGFCFDPPKAFSHVVRTKNAARHQRRATRMHELIRSAMAKNDWEAAAAAVAGARKISGYERDPALLSIIERLAERGSRKEWKDQWLHRVLTGHVGGVNAVHWLNGGRELVSAGEDRTLRRWTLESGSCCGVLQGHRGAVIALDADPSGGLALSADKEGYLIRWHLPSARGATLAAPGSSGKPLCVRLLRNGVDALVGFSDGRMVLIDLVRGAVLKTMRVDSSSIFCVEESWEGRYALTGHYDGKIRFWSLGDGKCRREIQAHAHAVTDVRVAPDGTRFVSASMDGFVKEWSLAGELRAEIPIEEDRAVSFISVLAERPFAACATGAGGVIRVDFELGKKLRRLEGQSGRVLCGGFSPNGIYLAGGGDEGRIYIWRLDWDWGFQLSRAAQEKIVEIGKSFVLRSEADKGGGDPRTILRELSNAGFGVISAAALEKTMRALQKSSPDERRRWLQDRYRFVD